MKKLFIQILLISILIFITQSNDGIDLWRLYNIPTYKCLKQKQFQLAIINVFDYDGTYINTTAQNILNAKIAGFKVDILMSFCRLKSASAQVEELFKNLNPSLYDRIWIDIQTNPNDRCSWNLHTPLGNCQYIHELVKKIKQKGKNPGIFTSRYYWLDVFGIFSGCKSLGTQDLWYMNWGDQNANFNDFISFGGWIKPFMKQWKRNSLFYCNIVVGVNFYN